MSRPTTSRRGDLGSAGHAVGPWWQQRVSAIFILLFLLWLLVALVRLPGLERSDLLLWFRSDAHALPVIGLLCAMAHHSYLGLRVVAEDYVPSPLIRRGVLIVALFLHTGLWGLGLLAVLRLSMGTPS